MKCTVCGGSAYGEICPKCMAFKEYCDAIIARSHWKGCAANKDTPLLCVVGCSKIGDCVIFDEYEKLDQNVTETQDTLRSFS